MLEIIRSMGKFPFAAVMQIYSGSNGELAHRQWPDLPPEQGLYRAEQEMYDFLRYDFFTRQDAFCALWRDGSAPVSAVRLERWRDGWLLEGLETRPDCRGKGYAEQLLETVLQLVSGTIYSHVHRGNQASLKLHEKMGFRISAPTAMLDGSYLPGYLTLVKE